MSVHILVEDGSPLIQYTPDHAWTDAALNDTLAMSYSGGSYHATSMQGATATFHFSGTGFMITGGRRPGYGPFSITLDGQQLFNGNPTPGSSPIDTLASFTGLPNEQHTVILTNTGGMPMDIDAITFETQIGPTGNFSATTIDDTNPHIQYLPQNAWSINSRPEFQDGTLHFSQAPDASAVLQFTGNAIAYYGTVSPDHADISISIDNETMKMLNGSLSRVFVVRTQVLLWWANGLTDGEHTMTVTKIPDAASGPFVDVDSFVVYSETQAPVITNSTQEHPAVSSNTVSHSSVIVGATIASVAVVLLTIVGLFLFLKQRRSRRQNASKFPISCLTPTLPMQGIVEFESARFPISVPNGEGSAFPFPPSAPLTPLRKAESDFKRTSKLSVAPSYYGDPDLSSDRRSERRSQTASEVSRPPVPRLKAPYAIATASCLQPIAAHQNH